MTNSSQFQIMLKHHLTNKRLNEISQMNSIIRLIVSLSVMNGNLLAIFSRVASLFKLPPYFFDGSCHFRDYLEGITHDAVIGCFEERSFRIFIDYNDNLAAINTSEVLNRT